MNKDVELSRLRISRRRALALGGSVSLTGLLAACSGGGSSTTAATASSVSGPSGASGVSGASGSLATGTVDEQLLALLDQAPRCVLAVEETQGPYWFDVDSIRSDIREDRPGLELNLAMRVQDLTNCSADGSAGAVATPSSKSGTATRAGCTPASNPVPSPRTRAGVWAGVWAGRRPVVRRRKECPKAAPVGRLPAAPGRYGRTRWPRRHGRLGRDVGRLVQRRRPGGHHHRRRHLPAGRADHRRERHRAVHDDLPGWYTGRTVHIHLKVHIDKKTVLTTQLYFDDALNDDVFSTVPRTPTTPVATPATTPTASTTRDGLMATSRQPDRMLAAINLGIDV